MNTPTVGNIDDQSSRNGEVLVRVENVSKKFCRSLKKSLWYGLKDIAGELNLFSGSSGHHTRSGMALEQTRQKLDLRTDEFWAIDDVSFELRRGECLGLIGHNGAGKTTLLKMLNGLIKPDGGRIKMQGRVGALIALGAGFNPILTGRENIYVNASILGLSKREIDKKLEEIIDFAEIGEFIDSPVQSYSSGMQVRLGFAVASSVVPDVLLLDEVLAVGDMKFQAKCLARIANVRKGGTAIIFVSHNNHQMSMVCERGLVLQHGKMVTDNSIRNAIDVYNSLGRNSNLDRGMVSKWSEKCFDIELLQIQGANPGSKGLSIAPNSEFTLEFCVSNAYSLPVPIIVDTRVEDSLGTLAQCSSLDEPILLAPGRNSLAVNFGGIATQDCNLIINVAIWSKEDRSIIAWSRGHELYVSPHVRTAGREACNITFKLFKC